MRSPRPWVLLFLAILAFGVTVVQARELPEGFRLEPVVTGLNEPSSVSVAADGRILITERTTGDLLQVRHGELAPVPLCQVTVETAGEAGLLGVAAHPEFDRNGWVYLYYTAPGGDNKVTRFTVRGDSCSGATDILTNLGHGVSFLRNGGGIAFGPNGKLYVATGDMEAPGDAQNPSLPNGKIIQVNDDGTGAAFYAQGLRDGRGLAIDSNGQVYGVDRGDVSDSSCDELNAVPSGGDLGWNAWTCGGSATYVNPLADRTTSIGLGALAVYGAAAFPDLAADGSDSDYDRFGPDGLPGFGRKDENATGQCLGSSNNGNSCSSDVDCPARAGELASCFFNDDPDEYCPGGVAVWDDACGADGIDEPDESFIDNLFMTSEGDDTVLRAVLEPADPTALNVEGVFLDSTARPTCPTGWTGVATGNDGWLYLVAENGGGTNGGLYRVIHDAGPGPREVSPVDSHFPLMVKKGAGDDVTVLWEDLRTDSMQPRDDGNPNPDLRNPLPPAREYTVWEGILGNFTSHAPASGLGATPGTEVNGAYREASFSSPGNHFYLVSGRGDNLEGTLGYDSGSAERAGYAVTDLCQTTGFYDSGGGALDDLWLCGQDFTLRDETGTSRSLYEFRGRPVVLDLSAVWCGPCQTEAASTESMNLAYKDLGAVVLTVLIDDEVSNPSPDGRPSPGDCLKFGDRVATNWLGSNPPSSQNHTFPCLADTELTGQPQRAWPKYGSGFLPTNLVLDTGMRVVYADSGYDQLAITDKLDALLSLADTCLP